MNIATTSPPHLFLWYHYSTTFFFCHCYFKVVQTKPLQELRFAAIFYLVSLSSCQETDVRTCTPPPPYTLLLKEWRSIGLDMTNKNLEMSINNELLLFSDKFVLAWVTSFWQENWRLPIWNFVWNDLPSSQFVIKVILKIKNKIKIKVKFKIGIK